MVSSFALYGWPYSHVRRRDHQRRTLVILCFFVVFAVFDINLTRRQRTPPYPSPNSSVSAPSVEESDRTNNSTEPIFLDQLLLPPPTTIARFPVDMDINSNTRRRSFTISTESLECDACFKFEMNGTLPDTLTVDPGPLPHFVGFLIRLHNTISDFVHDTQVPQDVNYILVGAAALIEDLTEFYMAVYRSRHPTPTADINLSNFAKLPLELRDII